MKRLNNVDIAKGQSEEDTKLKFITPALQKAGWSVNDDMLMEVPVGPGRMTLDGKKAKRGAPKKADYMLFCRKNYPIAIVEAKKWTSPSSAGLEQAKEYGWVAEAPFVYSTNGKEFVEYEWSSGKLRRFGMDEFPSKEELIARYERLNEERFGPLQPSGRLALEQPYYSGQGFNHPRYYQQIAINRTVEAIARGRDRALLVMATGTGKTYTAFQIIYRLLESGLKKKVLYLADRNVLVDQSIQQDFKPLEKRVYKVGSKRPETKSTLRGYEVYFSLYQQLVGDNDEEKFRDLFDPDFFDLIVVDECHRGSAKADSCWRRILEYFSSATQLGMTATPKESSKVSNIDYFGKPLYSYSLKNGVNDGFLAPFRVINVKTDIGEGWRPSPGQVDSLGNPIENRVYNNSDFDKNIVLLDRTREVALHITRYLKKFDRMARTIVFCPTTDAALRMRDELINLNSDMMKANPDYVVRITSDDEYGSAKLKAFISTGEKYPVIATTSKLLSTGVDCKLVKLIVLDTPMSSMTEFKQIIGRGTRLREDCGKTHFTVMDFRNVTRLFNDEAWDGEIEQDPTFDPDAPVDELEGVTPSEDDPKSKAERIVPIVDRDGCKVTIVGEVVSILDESGQTRTENIVDFTRRNLLGEYPTLERFVSKWRSTTDHREIREWLEALGVKLEELKEQEGMLEMDDFDFICHVAFDRKPLTRRERARKTRGCGFFDKYSGVARKVLETLMEVYMNADVIEIEGTNGLNNPMMHDFGKPKKIVEAFGGKEGYLAAVAALESAMYSEEAA